MQPQSLDIRMFWWAYWLYLAAFLLFTLYGAIRGRRVGQAATAALGVGFVLHSLGIAWRWKLSGHAPMANMFEYASLLAWMAVLSYIFIELRYRKTIVGSFVSPVVVIIMTCASLLPKEITQQLMPALQSYWLAIHVSLAALGEGAFAVALAVSIMYLVKERRAAALAQTGRSAAQHPHAARKMRAAGPSSAASMAMAAGMACAAGSESGPVRAGARGEVAGNLGGGTTVLDLDNDADLASSRPGILKSAPGVEIR